MLFDVFEWLRLYALLNSIGPRIVLMYIMHVQSAHFLGFFFIFTRFSDMCKTGITPFQIMLCELNIYYVYKLEYVTVCTHLKIWPAF